MVGRRSLDRQLAHAGVDLAFRHGCATLALWRDV